MSYSPHSPTRGYSSTPEPQNVLAAEQELQQEYQRERSAIHRQPYRSIPLVAPGAKIRHDIPMGSYLRHMESSAWRPTNTYSPQRFQSLPRDDTKIYNTPLYRVSSPTPVNAPGYFQPHGKRAGPKQHRVIDLSLSPTYQLLKEQEEDSSGYRSEPESPRKPSPLHIPINVHPGEKVNAFGTPKSTIQQSGSFKTLMLSLMSPHV